MKLTLIRHAPTEYNAKGLFMGALDLSSSRDGLLQAQQLGVDLKGFIFTKYYCSPLKRTLQTAKAIFPDAKIELDQDLRERALGNWSGRSKKEMRDVYPEAFLPSGHINPFFVPEGGEPIEDVMKRVSNFLEKIKSESDGHIVAVTHNGVLRVFRCIVEEKPAEQIFQVSEEYLTPKTFAYEAGKWLEIPYEFS